MVTITNIHITLLPFNARWASSHDDEPSFSWQSATLELGAGTGLNYRYPARLM